MPRTRKSDVKGGLAEASPHYLGHRERLRERFLNAGPDAVTEYELLELVLFRAIPRRDVKPLAKALIAKFGSFGEVVSAPRQRLREIEGLGEAAIAEIKIVQAAANRLARGEAKKRTVLSSWSAVLDYCRTTMAFATRSSSACCSSTSATRSSPTSCSRPAPWITRRSIRARWSSARWN